VCRNDKNVDCFFYLNFAVRTCLVHSYEIGMWLFLARVVRDHCGKSFRKATIQYICSPLLYV